jgi:hypothetical protein
MPKFVRERKAVSVSLLAREVSDQRWLSDPGPVGDSEVTGGCRLSFAVEVRQSDG